MSTPNKEFLEDWEREAVLYIERMHSTTGAVPQDDDIIKYLRFMMFSKTDIESLKTNPLFLASCSARGITINTGEGQLNAVKSLTQRQMAAVAIMLNLTDRRSDEKKLRDLGISTEEWTSWSVNAAFSEYLRARSEMMISNSVHEAHMGLMRGVRQGNTASIKLYYELSGRYNPNEENQVNVRMLIGRVLEAIQKHVRNPDTLNQLAIELSQLAIEAGSPVANSSIVAGQSTRKELS